MNRRITVSEEVAKLIEQSSQSAEELIKLALVNKGSEGLKTREGITLPNGTALLSWYKDRAYYANVSNGTIEIMGQNVDTISAAAKLVTKTQVNGWTFWKVRRPSDNDFVPISKLRLVKSNNARK